METQLKLSFHQVSFLKTLNIPIGFNTISSETKSTGSEILKKQQEIEREIRVIYKGYKGILYRRLKRNILKD